MRPIHTTKRLYSIAPLKSTRTPTTTRPRRTSLSLASVVSSAPSSPPGSSNVSVGGNSGSRSYHTNATGSLNYIESPPLTSSRPSGSNPSSSSRATLGETLGEAGSSQNAGSHPTSPTANPGSGPGSGSGTNSAQSSHSPNTSHSQLTSNSPNGQSSHHSQTSNGSGQQAEGWYPSTTLLTVDGSSPQPSSSPPDQGFFLPGSRTGLASNYSWRPHEGTIDNTERASKDASESVPKNASPQKIYQLEVGAYGIPKRGRERESTLRPITRSTTSACPKCLEEHMQEEENEDGAYSTDHLEYAVQVGEDAYFVRNDALGVADGVGGWASRHQADRTSASSGMHECNICSTASSSSNHGHQHQLHSPLPSHTRMHLHRSPPRRPVQPSPSALFARRLMHFSSHEVGEAQARACRSTPTSGSRSTSPTRPRLAPVTMTTGSGSSLKNGGISPSLSQHVRGLQKTVVQEPRREGRYFGNARPFAWPWDDNYDYNTHCRSIENEDPGVPVFGSASPGLGILLEKEGASRNRDAATHVSSAKKEVYSSEARTTTDEVSGSSDGCATTSNNTLASAEPDPNLDPVTEDPLEGTIDPVEVLERAYEKTIEAHRVKRRVRVVKEEERKATGSSSARWWSYGSALGLSSPSPSLQQTSSGRERQTPNQTQTQLDSVDVDYEWLDTYEPLTTGSSTALLAVLSGDLLRVAHLGDCVGWLVRAGEIVWRSEEMWWGFNYPVQLGPSSPTQPSDARRYELTVQADDILILASDGVSDNCWEEDVLDEVRRAVEVHFPLSHSTHSPSHSPPDAGSGPGPATDLLGRRTLAGMLSEALCSRARQLSMQGRSRARARVPATKTTNSNSSGLDANVQINRIHTNAKGTKFEQTAEQQEEEELPFERRAREEGRPFRGGKSDDISVLVAIISPVSPSPSPHAIASAEESSAKTESATA